VRLVDDLLESVAGLDCPVKRVCVGLHWTVVESRFTGIAHTYKTNRKVELESSGNLLEESALELASRLKNWEPLESSLGLAALNSLIEPIGRPLNVFTHILSIARGKRVTVVGRFPTNDQIAEAAGRAYLLETDPEAGELPCWAAEEVIPASDLVVITAAALINKSLSRLLELSKRATTIVVGPSAPMNTILFRHGADIVAGVRVTNPDALISSVMQGAKQFRRLAGLEPIVQMPAGQ
jgi:uncharacterized protein (DUF4213/DUF364 family)